MTGRPDDAAFVAFIYEPRQGWSITPSVELASDRWSEVTGGGYVRTGEYTLLNLQAQYRGGDTVGARGRAATNLMDENFSSPMDTRSPAAALTCGSVSISDFGTTRHGSPVTTSLSCRSPYVLPTLSNAFETQSSRHMYARRPAARRHQHRAVTRDRGNS